MIIAKQNIAIFIKLSLKALGTYIFAVNYIHFLGLISLVSCRVSKIIVSTIIFLIVFPIFPHLTVGVFWGLVLPFMLLWNKETLSPSPLHILLLFAQTTVCRKWHNYTYSFVIYTLNENLFCEIRFIWNDFLKLFKIVTIWFLRHVQI